MRYIVSLGALTIALICNAHANLPSKAFLPDHVARQMVDQAVKKAKEQGLSLTIAVVDDAGLTRQLYSMDHARSVSVDVSQRKAQAAAQARTNTRTMMERNTEKVGFAYNNFPHVVLLPGGVPIQSAQGQPLGAIGVSGASGDQDEAIALHAIDSVKQQLAD